MPIFEEDEFDKIEETMKSEEEKNKSLEKKKRLEEQRKKEIDELERWWREY